MSDIFRFVDLDKLRKTIHSFFRLPEEILPCFKMAPNVLKLAIEEYKGKRVELSPTKELEKEKNEERAADLS